MKITVYQKELVRLIRESRIGTSPKHIEILAHISVPFQISRLRTVVHFPSNHARKVTVKLCKFKKWTRRDSFLPSAPAFLAAWPLAQSIVRATELRRRKDCSRSIKFLTITLSLFQLAVPLPPPPSSHSNRLYKMKRARCVMVKIPKYVPFLTCLHSIVAELRIESFCTLCFYWFRGNEEVTFFQQNFTSEFLWSNWLNVNS